ncbi:MAG: hypothetical protein E7515_04570 [Ruminococcaceae bacterium]|jgi:hypothetical protein|nr:hypothetical protein [Oscillospiraceae bacterium]
MNMKNKSLKIIIIIFAVIITVGFSVFGWHIIKNRLTDPSRQASPVLKAITRNRDDNKINYSVIYDSGNIAETEAFIPDKVVFLNAGSNYVSKVENGKIIVTLDRTRLTDSNGNEVEPDETVKKLMKTLARESEHDILGAIIIIDGDNYYAFVEHNVNLCVPCHLYRYEKNEDTLTDLYCWNYVDLIGIAEYENEE